MISIHLLEHSTDEENFNLFEALVPLVTVEKIALALLEQLNAPDIDDLISKIEASGIPEVQDEEER